MERGQLPDIIKTTLAENHLLTASQLTQKINRAGRDYHRSSIYRAIEKLIEEGVICRQHLADNSIYYELRHKHDHLVCEKCGKVSSVKNIYSHPKTVKSFKVEHHHLTLYGVCHECR